MAKSVIPNPEFFPNWNGWARSLIKWLQFENPDLELRDETTDQEYIIPGFIFKGKPVYRKSFQGYIGVTGTIPAPAAKTKAHGIANIDLLGHLEISGTVLPQAGLSAWPLNAQNPNTGGVDYVVLDATNIIWNVNYNALFVILRPTLEYQKL